jgi:membrane-associated phospholipid phosphatase
MKKRMRTFRVAGLTLGLTDVVTLGGLFLLTFLAAAFRARIASPNTVMSVNAVFIVLYIISLAALARAHRPWLRFAVRTVMVQVTFLQIFKAASELQLAFFPWQDDRVLALEHAVFGAQPLVVLQKLYSRPLNEWMFFVYVFYVVIYPVLGGIIFFRSGEAANEDYLFELGLVNIVCGLGFLVFPVASPMYWAKAGIHLTEPLTAGLFGGIGEWIRTNVHQAGGSIPSPHCAVATVMWFMAKRYTRHAFLWLAPIILSLYVSTVYLRYHYVTDMVTGIAAGLLVLLLAPSIERAWNGKTAPPRRALT